MTGARPLRPTATMIDCMLSDLSLLAKPTLPKAVELRINNRMPDHPVLLDSGLLQDGLLNLILNARDACGMAGVITLEVRLVHDTWIEFILRDDGPGFSGICTGTWLCALFHPQRAEGRALGCPWSMT